jgi:hypothetical protein
MRELLAFIGDELSWLFNEEWFRIVDGGSRRRSSSVTVRSRATLLEIVNENGEFSARISSVEGDPDWFWIGVVFRLFLAEKPGSDVLDAGSAGRLREVLQMVDTRLGTLADSDDLLAALVEARSSRADEVFGV